MADPHECALWPLLRLAEFYRLDENDETGHVFPTCSRSCQFYIIEFTSVAWDITPGGRMYGELDAVFETVAV